MRGPSLSTSARFSRNAIASCSNSRPKCRSIALQAHSLRTGGPSNGLKATRVVYNPVFLERRVGVPPTRPPVLTQILIGSQRPFHSSSPALKNPYTVLGLSKDASSSDIKKAYFQLAKKYHPDTNQDPASKERFIEIQTAYETLGDDQKRAAYDTYGETSQQPGFSQDPFGGQPFPGSSGFSGSFTSSGMGMEDLFSSLFGGGVGGRGRASARGDDLEASISISFMEGAKGTTKTINIMPVVDCEPCSGSGLRPGVKRIQCKTCLGTGTQTMVLNSGFQMASPCRTCQGTGASIPRGGECDDCGGVGKIKYRKPIKVEVPAGVEDGMTIRVPGEGDAPMTKKGSKGDLLVRVNVGSSDVFRRQGTHLYHDAVIPLQTAVLGGKVRVPTLDSDVEVRVSPGTQPGEDCVLRGRGVDSISRKGSKGDLFISFSVEIPRSLTGRQHDLMQQYADDVEGRSPTESTTSSGEGGMEDEKRDTGTTGKKTQTHEQQKTEGGEASGSWRSKLKRLFGSRADGV